MPRTPDQLTKEYYIERGYHCTKVEGWNVQPVIRRKDFLGIYDYMAFNDAGEMIAIQTTTKQHMPERRRKMLAKKTFTWWTQGGRRSVLQGWYKKNNKWVVKEEELTMKDWEEYQAAEKKKIDDVPPDPELHKMLYGE